MVCRGDGYRVDDSRHLRLDDHFFHGCLFFDLPVFGDDLARCGLASFCRASALIARLLITHGNEALGLNLRVRESQ